MPGAAKLRPLACAAAAVLFLAGCKDAGRDHYNNARAQYQDLLEHSKLPTDPAFDPVVKELEQVKKGSSVYGKAQEMLGAIQRARANPRPPMPLVVRPGTSDEPADVATQRAKCIQLSQKLGETMDAKQREQVSAELHACQIDLEKAQESHHSDNP